MYAPNTTNQDGNVPCVQSRCSEWQTLRHDGIRKIRMGFFLLKGFFIFLTSFSDLNFASRAFYTCIYLPVERSLLRLMKSTIMILFKISVKSIYGLKFASKPRSFLGWPF